MITRRGTTTPIGVMAMKSISQSTNQNTSKQLVDNRLMDAGRKTPVLLLEAVQSELFEKATDWLKEAGVPDEVYQAFDMANMLQIHIGNLKTQTISDTDAEQVPFDLAHAVELAIKFGDKFFGWNVGDPQISEWNKSE
jgi:hypothetical protein